MTMNNIQSDIIRNKWLLKVVSIKAHDYVLKWLINTK